MGQPDTDRPDTDRPVTDRRSVMPADLAAQILAGAEGSEAADGRLPTERQMAVDLGVSRSSIRGALSLLEAQGLVVRQVGRGTFLRALEDQHGDRLPSDVPLTDLNPSDVMYVRLLFEPPAMPLVVSRATPRDIAEMDRCLQGGDKAGDYTEFEHWDTSLHRAIFRASHNPLLVSMYGAVEVARHGPLWGALKIRHDGPERRARYQREHHAIVEAIRDRNEESAVAAMRAHLAAVSSTIFTPIA